MSANEAASSERAAGTDQAAAPETGTTEAPLPPRSSARRLFATTILGLEAVIIVLAGLVLVRLEPHNEAAIWVVTAVVLVLALAAIGTLRSGVGIGIGSVLQIALVLSGIWIPMMWILGGVFLILWVMAVVLGTKIDRERKAYWEEHLAE